MKNRLIYKLFSLNLLTIAFVVFIVWMSTDHLARSYFVALMDKYHISPTESHRMFVDSVHRYLIWGSLAAVCFSSLFSFLIMRRILKPLTQMTRLTSKVVSGDFSDQIPVSTRDEVGQLARSFNRMIEGLAHLQKLRQTMIVDAAHELKTPLTNIQGYLEGIVDDVVPPSSETFRLLQEESERPGDLVSDMLKLSRAGGADLNLEIVKIHLLEAVTHLLDVFRLKLTGKNIRVEYSDIPRQCVIYADPHKIAQVLHNLFQNALQYTSPGGRLRIFSEDSQAETKITFANTSKALKEEDLPLIFERFYRGEKSRSREYGGAGIGLAIVKDIIDAHKGRVGARIEGEEVQVWFTLPVKAL
jgi:two-component system sensor histidine kinase BaeS